MFLQNIVKSDVWRNCEGTTESGGLQDHNLFRKQFHEQVRAAKHTRFFPSMASGRMRASTAHLTFICLSTPLKSFSSIEVLVATGITGHTVEVTCCMQFFFPAGYLYLNLFQYTVHNRSSLILDTNNNTGCIINYVFIQS